MNRRGNPTKKKKKTTGKKDRDGSSTKEEKTHSQSIGGAAQKSPYHAKVSIKRKEGLCGGTRYLKSRNHRRTRIGATFRPNINPEETRKL